MARLHRNYMFKHSSKKANHGRKPTRGRTRPFAHVSRADSEHLLGVHKPKAAPPASKASKSDEAKGSKPA